MATLVGICGYEARAIGAYTSGAVGIATISGSPTFDTGWAHSVSGKGGAVSLQCAKSASATPRYHQQILDAAQTAIVLRSLHKINSIPNTNTEVLVDFLSSATTKGSVRITTAGVVQAVIGNAIQTQNGPTVSAGDVIRVDTVLDVSANPWTINVQVYNETTSTGTVIAQASNAVAASTFDRFRIGVTSSSSNTVSVNVDDLAWSFTIGDYPLQSGYIATLIPDACGSHNVTSAGDFKDDAAANVVNGETTSYTKLTETAPGDTTSWIRQLAGSSSEYIEYTYGNTNPATGDNPRAVQAMVGWTASGTVGNNSTSKLIDGGSSANIKSGAQAATTLNNYGVFLAQAPSAVPWTDTLINALKLEHGFATSFTSFIRLTWSMLEVEYVNPLVDAGTVTATAVFAGSDAPADTSDGPPQTTGQLGNNGNHEAFAADFSYLTKFIFAEFFNVSQFQWQWIGDHSSLAEHWRLVAYSDVGGVPTALVFTGADQTIASVGGAGGTQTSSYSPSNLTLPAGTYWFGVQLQEAHAAPTYTNGGVTYDGSDVFSDGPEDPFTGTTQGTNLRDKLITYSTQAGGAASLSGTVSLADAGTVIATETDSDSEQTQDADSLTAVSVISMSEALADTGSVTAASDLTAAEALADGGSLTAIVDLTSLEELFDNNPTDSGEIIAVAVPSGVEALADAGSVTATAVIAEADSYIEAGTVTAIAVISGHDALADKGLVISLAGPFGTFLLSSKSEAGTIIVVAVVALTTQRIKDAGSLTAIAVLSSSERIIEAGTVTALVVLSGTEAWLFAGTITATAALALIFEALVEEGQTVVATSMLLGEALNDDGESVAVSSISTTLEGLGEAATVTATADIAGSEAWGFAGNVTAVSDISGFHFSSSPTGSKKGYAYPNMVLVYNAVGMDARTRR